MDTNNHAADRLNQPCCLCFILLIWTLLVHRTFRNSRDQGNFKVHFQFAVQVEQYDSWHGLVMQSRQSHADWLYTGSNFFRECQGLRQASMDCLGSFANILHCLTTVIAKSNNILIGKLTSRCKEKTSKNPRQG